MSLTRNESEVFKRFEFIEEDVDRTFRVKKQMTMNRVPLFLNEGYIESQDYLK